MATFRELWSAIAPAGSPLGSLEDAQLEREVAWVRVLKARVPAFDAFDPGDVAIVPGSALVVVAPGQPEMGILVDALVAGRAAGLLLIGAEGAQGALTALGEAAVAAGIAAIDVGLADPQQLERSAIGFLVNDRAELEHQAALIEASLEETALAGDDVGTLIAGVAAVLGRAVALQGRRGETLAVHAPEQAMGAAAAATAYLGGARRAALRVDLPAAPPAGAAVPDSYAIAIAVAEPAARRAPGADAVAIAEPAPRRAPGLEAVAVAEAAGRSATPARRAVRPGSPQGRLLLLGDRPASDLERVVAPRLARLLALELARAESVRQAHDTVRRSEQLPAAGPPWVILVARQIPAGAAPTLEAREEIRARVRALAPARRLALRGDAESMEIRLVLAADATDEGGAELAGRVAELLDRPVAVSRPFGGQLGRPMAEAEARSTLEAVEALPDAPRVARADRLPAYRLLLGMQSLPDGQRQARALLEPLLVGTADARRERLATLRAVLETSGLGEAAASLGVHRNTLAYRLRRIEALTGWRLGEPDLRLPLSIAVRLVQSEQE